MRGLGFIIIVDVLVSALLLGSCSPKVVEKITVVEDTVRVSDTVIVKTRPDTVRISVPASSQSVAVNDTASHLEDDLYISDAYWDGMLLHHSLMSKPGAQLTNVIYVTDTLRVRDREESHSKSENRTETVYVQPTLKDKALYAGTGFAACLVIAVIYGSRKKIKRIYELIGL